MQIFQNPLIKNGETVSGSNCLGARKNQGQKRTSSLGTRVSLEIQKKVRVPKTPEKNFACSIYVFTKVSNLLGGLLQPQRLREPEQIKVC